MTRDPALTYACWQIAFSNMNIRQNVGNVNSSLNSMSIYMEFYTIGDVEDILLLNAAI